MSDPQKRSQPIAIFAFLFLACSLLCATANAQPSITLSKKSGPPTSGILVSGRGFKPNAGVDIFFDTKDKALVVTNGKGEFHDARIHAPRSARPGEHWVTALERNNDKGAQEPFVVRTDWPEFQFGGDHAGVNPYENVLNKRNLSRLNLKWSSLQYLVIGGGIVVVDGVLYTGEYALKAATGAILWKQPALGPIYSVPAVANGVVYVGSDNGNLYALDAGSGKILWSYTTGGGVRSSPSIADGKVYFGSYDQNVYALDAATGSVVWKYSTGGGVESSPAIANGVVYVGSDDASLYALDANTGARLWSYQTGSNVVSSPSVAYGLVYFGSFDDTVYALGVETGNFRWSFQTGELLYSCPAVAGGVVYVAAWDGFLYALNAGTGAVIWNYPTGATGSSAVVANDVVYVGANGGPFDAIDARSGTLLWNYYANPTLYGSPVVANGVVYATGEIVDAFSLSADIVAQASNSANRPDLKTLHPEWRLRPSGSAALQKAYGVAAGPRQLI